MEKTHTINEQTISDFITSNQEAIVRDIARMIAVPSYQGDKPAEALHTILSIAESMGLSTHNEKNKIGWAQLGESDGPYLATIAHVDVVPPGDGWNSDPFKMEQKDGWLIGRGVVDDKGAAVLTLYLLKFLKEHDICLRYPVRTLFGTDEETGMTDIDYYLKNFPAPAFCFTPDADFPICNGEKGHYDAELRSKIGENPEIISIQGGFASNAVPGTAYATVLFSGNEWKPSPGVKAVLKNGRAELTATGKSGHASLPDGTINAIGLLVDALLENGIGNPSEQAYLKFLKQFHAASDGSSLGIECHDEHFSSLTIIGGTIEMQNGRMVQTADSRFPASISSEQITQALKKSAGDSAEIIQTSFAEPFYIEEGHAAIQACLQAYNQVMNRHEKPFTMGGGTYARHFPCAVSFGPQPRDLVRPDCYSTEHGANEAIPLKDLLLALKIYITAFLSLEQLSL